ncbi:MAG: hypothetical protein HOG73_00520 [Candidatus Marinimicrobia bacterium]|jgi:hypothetical protein|nr:hypothetical protein [Candidatus Neomarinimicrobiota bacterium]
MNRTLKTLVLFLLVSTVSFAVGQDKGRGESDGNKTTIVKDDNKGGGTVKGDKPDGISSAKKPKDVNVGQKARRSNNKPVEKKSSWLKRLFSKDKTKKESNPD